MPRFIKNINVLNSWLHENRDLKFKWGKNDCVLFVCTVLEQMGNIDFASKSRGSYASAKGALKHLKTEYQVDRLEDIADKVLGNRSPIQFAIPGSIVSRFESDVNIGVSLGVCNGDLSWFISDEGLVTVPTLSCEWCYNG